jgi:hypothetical protein
VRAALIRARSASEGQGRAGGAGPAGSPDYGLSARPGEMDERFQSEAAMNGRTTKSRNGQRGQFAALGCWRLRACARHCASLCDVLDVFDDRLTASASHPGGI